MGQAFLCKLCCAKGLGRDPWTGSIVERRCCQHQVSSGLGCAQLPWAAPGTFPSPQPQLPTSQGTTRGPGLLAAARPIWVLSAPIWVCENPCSEPPFARGKPAKTNPGEYEAAKQNPSALVL